MIYCLILYNDIIRLFGWEQVHGAQFLLHNTTPISNYDWLNAKEMNIFRNMFSKNSEKNGFKNLNLKSFK